MRKPYILAVDDDSAVLRAVERDLKSQFNATYRVVSADSPEKALDLVRQLTARGDRIALFVVDQRMPGMSGAQCWNRYGSIIRRPYGLCSRGSRTGSQSCAPRACASSTMLIRRCCVHRVLRHPPDDAQ